MLKTLRRIVQEVNAVREFGEALQILVQRVRDAIGTQACSAFLIDTKTNEYVLVATDGLNPESVGKVRLKRTEGLVGLVGEKGEPINVPNAPEHPNYHKISKLEEDKFKAFLGVPIVTHRQLFGVLVVQQEDERAFDEAEEAFLVTMSAQLAGVIAHADAMGNLEKLWSNPNKKKKRKGTVLKGIASVPGIGVGNAVVVYPLADLDAVPDRQPEDIDIEIVSFVEALASAREDIRNLSKRMATNLPPADKALFDVYLRILEDNSLGKEVISEIRAGNWAQGALRSVIHRHVQQFESMEDGYLRERADDFTDLGRRVLSHLQAQRKQTIEYPEQTILVGEEVAASALAEVPEGQLAGIISARGSRNSHVAILARALGIPTVMGVKGMDVVEIANKELIVDGYYGQIHVTPSHRLRKEYIALAKEEKQLDADLEQLRDQPAQTPDGHIYSLFINTGLGDDSGLSLTVGAEGIGLFRTEVPFMMRDAFPTEEEQRVLYRQLLNAFAPRPVIMRTLDVGGDKSLPYFPVTEENPFLGWRGIRLTLDHPDVFMIQLRAMLRASEGLENLRIMFPMISNVGEVDEAMRLLNKVHAELVEDGLDIKLPPVGVMIEVPSAVYQARQIANRVDFLSVGSNDLTQYLLAVDRNNARVANLYDSLHPSVLLALLQTLEGAHAEGKLVSVCGEMAGDPVSVILLMGMGFNALSMNSSSLPKIKWVIRNVTRKQARELLHDALAMEDPTKIRFHLEQALEELGLGGLVRAGR